MNAPAQVLPPKVLRIVPSARAEHISLESAPDGAAPTRPPHRKVQSSFKLKCALRGCSTEVSILEGHYLAVRCERLHMPLRKYVFDLRFANPQPVRVRHVAWYWIAASILLFAAAGGLIGMAVVAAAAPDPRLYGGAVCAIGAGVTTFFSLRRTTESLQFTSVHGGAPLVSILGGIGSAKAGKRFFIDVIKNINAAKLARPQPDRHFLRDAMREHHRLHELDVLSAADYAASKARILKAHA